MGTNITHCGSPGAGSGTKISHNLVLNIQMLAAAEGLALGEKLGMDPKKLTQILDVSTSGSACVRMFNPRPGCVEDSPSSRGYTGGYSLELAHKDVILALDCAEQVGAKVDLGHLTHAYQ